MSRTNFSSCMRISKNQWPGRWNRIAQQGVFSTAGKERTYERPSRFQKNLTLILVSNGSGRGLSAEQSLGYLVLDELDQRPETTEQVCGQVLDVYGDAEGCFELG